jgi:hypothetical protein
MVAALRNAAVSILETAHRKGIARRKAEGAPTAKESQSTWFHPGADAGNGDEAVQRRFAAAGRIEVMQWLSI